MQTGKLPLVGADVALEDAVEGLKQSKDAGLVLLKEGGALLFHAPDLLQQVGKGGGQLMRDVLGGAWLPEEHGTHGRSGATAIFIGAEAGRAIVGFLSKELYTRFAKRMYYCDKNSDHYYDSSEVKNLKRIAAGRWECGQGDNGVVS